MDRDVICVDGEIKTVSNEIINYLETLIAAVNSFNRTLKVVQRLGIQDEQIRGKLGNLAILLKDYRVQLNDILEAFKKDEAGFLRDMKSNDVFKFPASIISDIDILISMFR